MNHFNIGASELATICGMHKYNPISSDAWNLAMVRAMSRPQHGHPYLDAILLGHEYEREDELIEAVNANTYTVDDFPDAPPEVVESAIREGKAIKGKAELRSALDAGLIEPVAAQMVHPDVTPRGVAEVLGDFGETRIVATYSITDSNTRTYNKKLNDRIDLFCRIDGFKDGKLVEIKTRKNHLFTSIPEYERIQCHAMMYILGLRSCSVIQQYNGTTKTHNMRFSDKLWSTVCLMLQTPGEPSTDWLKINVQARNPELKSAIAWAKMRT